MRYSRNKKQMSEVTTLVASVDADAESIAAMNVQGEVIVANQSSVSSFTERKGPATNIKVISTETKGVGINRNIGLLLAQTPFVLFADDDMEYEDRYPETVASAFKDVPDADILVFNLAYKNAEGVNGRRINHQIQRLHFYNIMNYGAPRIAMRLDSQRRTSLWFSTEFGGGTIYGAGEDVLFLQEAVKRGLKIYSYPAQIATTDLAGSSWFRGYGEKYFYDKGAQFRAISQFFWPLLALQYVLRHREVTSRLGLFNGFLWLMRGARGYTKRLGFSEFVANIKQGVSCADE